MEAYTGWVRRNKEYVYSLESLANGLTWFLPERFCKSKVGPEAVTAILGMNTAINEHIITTTPRPGHEHSSFPYSLCITLLKDVETVVEVMAHQYIGDDKKWNFISITEATKVLARLVLFQSSWYKLLLHGGEITNDDPEPLNLQETRINGNNNPLSLEGRAISALNRFGENARMTSKPSCLSRVQRQQAIIEPPSRFGLLSCSLRPRNGTKEQPFRISDLEKDELRRRKILWALYMMRDPFFSKYTRQRFESVRNSMEGRRVLGILTDKAIELIIGVQTRYTYVSGS